MSNSMNEGQMVPKIEEKIEDANIVVNESDQGMMAAGSEGSKRRYIDPTTRLETVELTKEEWAQHLKESGN
jgi:hypothetical protein